MAPSSFWVGHRAAASHTAVGGRERLPARPPVLCMRLLSAAFCAVTVSLTVPRAAPITQIRAGVVDRMFQPTVQRGCRDFVGDAVHLHRQCWCDTSSLTASVQCVMLQPLLRHKHVMVSNMRTSCVQAH